MAADGRVVLLGRAGEQRMLDRLLADVRAGRSAGLVIRGEAGVGKTALLRYATEQSADLRLAHIAGVEAEMELPFAALHQLCAPMLAHLDALPKPQRDALSVALGLSGGAAPDRFLVALAVLTLLATVAEERPLVCVVDDAQWLDEASSQALSFVARRLQAESVAIMFAVRGPGSRPEFDGLPEMLLSGLDEEPARTLLARTIPGRVDARVRDRIVAETRGNPLALLELPRTMSAAELAGGFEFPGAGDLPSRIEERYAQRVAALPEATQRLMLLAAADPVGDATLLWRAARRFGIGPSALTAAGSSELLEIGARVRFRHPLVRSAVYRAAPPGDRRRVHEVLAEVTDPDADADRRAWHRALGTAGLDEGVAAELEHSAGRAQMRGGLAAAAAFLARAADSTVDPADRARRALAAAQAKHQAGAPEAALALVASAQAGPLDELQRARSELLRAQIAFTSNRGMDAPPLLLGAAKRLEPLDATLARETYLEALMAAQLAGRFASGAALQVAEAARAAPPPPETRGPDLLLDGFAALFAEGHGVAAPLLRRALDEFRHGDVVTNGGFRWLHLAEMAAIELWDYDAWRALAVREIQLVREAGALTVLTTALSVSIYTLIFAGELAAAASLIDEQRTVTEASGGRLAPHAALALAGWRGREPELSQLVETTVQDVTPRGEGIGLSAAHWASALLHNGRGEYDRALAAAEQLMDLPVRFDQAVGWALPELVEAAARSGRTDVAHDGLARFSQMTRAAGTDWALGLEARSRALVSDDDAADGLYREAIERLGRTRVRAEHARAHLLYGEWLRRDGSRREAREHLRTAHRMFSEMGVEAFGERARRELVATGETVRKRTVTTRDELTAQERQISELARDGLSNTEIATRLFLSPRTIEWHLRKVFTKLGITSRRELASALPASGPGFIAA